MFLFVPSLKEYSPFTTAYIRNTTFIISSTTEANYNIQAWLSNPDVINRS